MIEKDLKIIERINFLHKNCKVLGSLIKPIEDLYSDGQDGPINLAMARIGTVVNSIISDISDVDIKALWFSSINYNILDEFTDYIPKNILDNLQEEFSDSYILYAEDWLFYSDISFEQYIDKVRKIFNKYDIDYIEYYNKNVEWIYHYRTIDEFNK